MSTINPNNNAARASLATASGARAAWLLFIAAFLGTAAISLLIQLVFLFIVKDVLIKASLLLLSNNNVYKK